MGSDKIESMSLFINGKWIDFGFSRLDIPGKSNKAKARNAVSQYNALGYTEKVEKVFIRDLFGNEEIVEIKE